MMAFLAILFYFVGVPFAVLGACHVLGTALMALGTMLRRLWTR